MRSFALAFAAALATLAGTGCGSSSCDQTLTIPWQLTDPSGHVWSCANAGVAFVDVYVNGVLQVNAAPCSNASATIFGVPNDTHEVVVEGLDAGLHILDRDEFITSAGCGGFTYPASAGEGVLNLDYHFTPADACGGATSMWYRVTDVIANQVIDEIGSSSGSDAASAACSVAGGNDVLGYTGLGTVPYGTYRLDYIEEVDSPLSSPLVLYQDCTSHQVDVVSPGPTGLPATLSARLAGEATCAP
jgi:hypothetical protein